MKYRRFGLNGVVRQNLAAGAGGGLDEGLLKKLKDTAGAVRRSGGRTRAS